MIYDGYDIHLLFIWRIDHQYGRVQEEIDCKVASTRVANDSYIPSPHA